MERLQDSLQISDHVDFMGKEGFVWWYGVVEDRKDPLYLGRVKVRCMGFHTDDKSLIPTEDLPWAQVILPITSASMSGIGVSPTGLVEGSHVFGFFRDAHEAQEPVVLGACIGIPSSIANRKRGFFDPRKYKQRKKYPYPPLFTDRNDEGKGATIVDFDEEGPDGEPYVFNGKNNFTEKGGVLTYVKRNDKVMANVTADDGTLLYSQQAYSSFPNENMMRFDPDGGLIYSVPSTNMNAGTSLRLNRNEKTLNPVANLLSMTGRINREINESAMTIHTAIPTIFSVDNEQGKFFQQPRNYVDPEYPFNHVQYTESGHLFEMDDSPGAERIRLLHRSLSFYEIDKQGDKIENVVGSSFLFNDGDKFSHIIGNEFKTIGGGLSLIVNDRKTPSQSGIRVGEKGSFFIETEGGDIWLRARGALNIEAAEINTAKIPLDSSNASDYAISERNINFSKIPTFKVESDNLEFKTKSEIKFKSSSFTASSEGDLSLASTGGNINVNALNNIQESILGKPGFVSRSSTAALGKMEFSCFDILTGGFDFKIGLDAGAFGPPLQLTQMEIAPGGITLESNAPTIGEIKFSSLGKVVSDSVFGFEVKDKKSISIKKETIPGLATEISINEAGLVSIKNQTTSLFAILNELLTAISSLSVGTGTGPSTPPLNVGQFSKIQADLSTFLTA
tara:strand:+ start:119 stop:2146 length:2028 start_codon:yes stop_codon:yes gene_type:complete